MGISLDRIAALRKDAEQVKVIDQPAGMPLVSMFIDADELLELLRGYEQGSAPPPVAETVIKRAWDILPDWSVVCMLHTREGDEKFLFVAMTKDGRVIEEEGKDDEFLWNRLWHKAEEIKKAGK